MGAVGAAPPGLHPGWFMPRPPPSLPRPHLNGSVGRVFSADLPAMQLWYADVYSITRALPVTPGVARGWYGAAPLGLPAPEG